MSEKICSSGHTYGANICDRCGRSESQPTQPTVSTNESEPIVEKDLPKVAKPKAKRGKK